MHFTVEIAVCGGYPSKHVRQIASAIIARAIRTFSARGVDPQRYICISLGLLLPFVVRLHLGVIFTELFPPKADNTVAIELAVPFILS